MEIFVLVLMVAALGAWQLKSKNQAGREALLGGFLGRHQVDRRMDDLIEAYLRALEDHDPARQARAWTLLAFSEQQLVEQVRRFAEEFSVVDEANARVSKLPAFLPETDRFFPANTFDMRRALVVHAEALERAAGNARGRSPRDKAYTVSAELLLMRHTCHWYCHSRTVASARMLARHQTPYAQLLASVDAQTREAYLAAIGR